MDAHTLEDEFEELLAAAYRSSFGKDPTDLWLAAIASRAGTRGAVATLNQAGDLLGFHASESDKSWPGSRPPFRECCARNSG